MSDLLQVETTAVMIFETGRESTDSPVGVQLAYDVTLGDDADDTVGPDHHHGADVVTGEPGRAVQSPSRRG